MCRMVSGVLSHSGVVVKGESVESVTIQMEGRDSWFGACA